jgi:hypothetical protein
VAAGALPTSARRHTTLALKVAVTLGAVVYLVMRQPVSDLLQALSSISQPALVAAIAFQLGALAVGTVRWRALLAAYGARVIPPFGQLFKVYLVGQFYNVYVPGAVGGDLLRGVVTRKSFASGSATGAVAVVFVERALGAAGVLVLFMGSAAVFALERFAGLLPLCALGVLGVGAGVVTLTHGARLARRLPRRLARVLEHLPVLVRPGPFLLACLLSLATQSLVALGGHVLAHSVAPQLTLADSFVAMPLAGAAGFFPLTVAGIGPRDMIVKSLYERLGASPAAASATAFAFLFATLLTALVGGVVQLVRPIGIGAAASELPDSPGRGAR